MSSPKPSLLDQVRTAVRLRHYSIRTEEAYLNVIRRFILYHKKRHPKEMGVDEIRQYLSHLATDGNVAASTQNVALSALLFLYREVLQIDLPLIEGIERAKRPQRVPVVLTTEEEKSYLGRVDFQLHGRVGVIELHLEPTLRRVSVVAGLSIERASLGHPGVLTRHRELRRSFA